MPAMRFDPLFCPERGEMARGTLETITGVAEFEANDDGTVEYSGDTDIWWNAQETVTDEGGNVRLVCPTGHEWSARLHESEQGR
jgi:hypothetical protein